MSADRWRWTPSREQRLFVAVALSCVAVFLYRVITEAWITDDALITFRYVSNWVHGDGLVYNAGERVEGFSNFLFVCLLVPFGAVGADLFVTAQALGIAFGVAELGGILWLTRRQTASVWMAGVAGGLFATDRIVAVWTTGGLETSMHSALLFSAFALAVFYHPKPLRGVVPVTCLHIAVAASRPEGAAFYPLYVAYLGATGWRDGSWKHMIKRSAGIFIVAVAALVALRWAYYGELVANPYRAKMAGVPRAELGLLYVKELGRRMGALSVVHGLAWVALAGAAITAYRASRRDPERSSSAPWSLVYAGAFVVAGVAIVGAMGGDYMTDFRFFRPILGIFYFGVACSLSIALGSHGRLVRGLAVVSLVAVCASHGYRQYRPNPIAADAPLPGVHKQILAVSADRATQFAEALGRFAEPGDKLLVDLSGVRGFGHDYYTIDATGLLSKNISRDFYLREMFTERGARQRYPGHARWPSIPFMQREGFEFIFPKISDRPPSYPEINDEAPRRQRRYPFLHVTIGLGGDRYFRFFTTLTVDQVVQRARRRQLEVCYRLPWQALQCENGGL